MTTERTPTTAAWTCEVSGPVAHADLPPGADLPMRQAVRAAYREVTGQDETYLSSGWGRAEAVAPFAAEVERLRADIDAALRTALSVVLHEHLDPDCTGDPPYDVTQAMAEAVLRAPVVVAALAPEPETGQ